MQDNNRLSKWVNFYFMPLTPYLRRRSLRLLVFWCLVEFYDSSCCITVLSIRLWMNCYLQMFCFVSKEWVFYQKVSWAIEDPNLSLVATEESIIRRAFLIIVLGNNFYALLPFRRSDLRVYLYIIWTWRVKLGNSTFRKILYLSSWFYCLFRLLISREFLPARMFKLNDLSSWIENISLLPTNLLKVVGTMLSG